MQSRSILICMSAVAFIKTINTFVALLIFGGSVSDFWTTLICQKHAKLADTRLQYPGNCSVIAFAPEAGMQLLWAVGSSLFCLAACIAALFSNPLQTAKLCSAAGRLPKLSLEVQVTLNAPLPFCYSTVSMKALHPKFTTFISATERF